MAIFYLRPLVAGLDDARWESSRFRSEAWVNAADEAEARALASGKFTNGEPTIPGHAGPPNPWLAADLVEVRELSEGPDGMSIPNGTVVASQQV